MSRLADSARRAIRLRRAGTRLTAHSVALVLLVLLFHAAL